MTCFHIPWHFYTSVRFCSHVHAFGLLLSQQLSAASSVVKEASPRRQIPENKAFAQDQQIRQRARARFSCACAHHNSCCSGHVFRRPPPFVAFLAKHPVQGGAKPRVQQSHPLVTPSAAELRSFLLRTYPRQENISFLRATSVTKL